MLHAECLTYLIFVENVQSVLSSNADADLFCISSPIITLSFINQCKLHVILYPWLSFQIEYMW